ncbi:hypothetical protein DFH06DRAFT_1185264 [Mycena polygramma]|nr:hypothetical protein DFH06DRAFT_1185264 [Mycena polygramma]
MASLAYSLPAFHWILDPYQDTPEPLPPTIRELCADRKQVLIKYPPHLGKLWRLSRRPPSLLARLLPSLAVPAFPEPTALFAMPHYDTPAASFYRIYQFAVIHDDIRFRNEIEYFCHKPWPIASLPDPQDCDPERAAFLAALTHILCASFNDRIERGLPRDAPAYIKDFDALRRAPKTFEVPPPWAQKVPPLKRQLKINAKEGDRFLSVELGRMGIVMRSPPYLFC